MSETCITTASHGSGADGILLHAQTPGYITNLVVRTNGDPMTHAAAIRRAIHEADPAQAVSAVGTLEEDVAKVLARPRLQATLVASFAGISLVLAVVGVYGLIAYVVAQRTQEIGIRLALGATSQRIFGTLFAEGAWLVVGGLVIGVSAAVLLRGPVATLVFGVTPGDPLTYSIAATPRRPDAPNRRPPVSTAATPRSDPCALRAGQAANSRGAQRRQERLP
ncbi:MAG TPA: FtsX-like permease family protein [Vicinamibacterales bacterium]|nr:FtsX-like permease family protein [Vicinamibacterales bacterium]